MDELKKYFKEHERELDIESPEVEGIWQRLESKKPAQRPAIRTLKSVGRVSAAACIILLAAIAGWQYAKEDRRPPKSEWTINTDPAPETRDSVIQKTDPVSVVKTKKEIKKTVTKFDKKQEQSAEDGFTKAINYQRQRLRNTVIYAEDPVYFDSFKVQLQQMDKDELQLKKDINAYGLNDELLEQLINIYQRKLHLLQELQGEIKKMNDHVNESNSRDELRGYYLNI